MHRDPLQLLHQARRIYNLTVHLFEWHYDFVEVLNCWFYKIIIINYNSQIHRESKHTSIRLNAIYTDVKEDKFIEQIVVN
jgi:hypothetical protein